MSKKVLPCDLHVEGDLTASKVKAIASDGTVLDLGALAISSIEIGEDIVFKNAEGQDLFRLDNYYSKEETEDTEEVTAAALNDLNERILDLENRLTAVEESLA